MQVNFIYVFDILGKLTIVSAPLSPLFPSGSRNNQCRTDRSCPNQPGGFRYCVIVSSEKQSRQAQQQPPVYRSGHGRYRKPSAFDGREGTFAAGKGCREQNPHNPVAGLLPGHFFGACAAHPAPAHIEPATQHTRIPGRIRRSCRDQCS